MTSASRGSIVLAALFCAIMNPVYAQKQKEASAGPARSWRYVTRKDSFTDKVRTRALLTSTNKASFAFPYGGGSQAHLLVRMDDEGKPELLFMIDRGQFVCPEQCILRVRIDNTDPVEYGAERSEDGSARVMFLGYYSGPILEKIADAKRLRVSTEFYQEGWRTFDFNPGGLNLSRLR